MSLTRCSLCVPLMVFVSVTASPASAQTPEAAGETSTPSGAETSADQPARRLRPHTDDGRPIGIAEFGVGLLTLPGADLCVDPFTGCESGDTSVELHAWPLFRLTPDVAVGAGASLALTPNTDAPRVDPPGLPRDHSRGYFSIETTARYYAIDQPNWEGWGGLTAGLVVISDTFSIRATDEQRALIGPRGTTIRTEGYTLGLGAGAAYKLGRHFTLGGSVHFKSWFFPTVADQNSFGDSASLVGRVSVFNVSADVGYRLPL